jgi:hypothetical protein
MSPFFRTPLTVTALPFSSVWLGPGSCPVMNTNGCSKMGGFVPTMFPNCNVRPAVSRICLAWAIRDVGDIRHSNLYRWRRPCNSCGQCNGWDRHAGELAVLDGIHANGSILLQLIQRIDERFQHARQVKLPNINELLGMELNVFNIIDFLCDVIPLRGIVGEDVGGRLDIDPVTLLWRWDNRSIA